MEAYNLTANITKTYNLSKNWLSLIHTSDFLFAITLYLTLLTSQITLIILSSLDAKFLYLAITLIVYTALLIRNGLAIRTWYQGSNIKITEAENQIATYSVYRNSYEDKYSIHNIKETHKTPFSIIVYGDISRSRSYFKGSPSTIDISKKRLRIPACYENMDELYSELERIKGQNEYEL